MFAYLFVFLPIYLSFYLSTYNSMYLSIYQSVCAFQKAYSHPAAHIVQGRKIFMLAHRPTLVPPREVPHLPAPEVND